MFPTRHRSVRFLTAITGAIGIAFAATPAAAVIDPLHQFVVNGGFEQTTNGLGELTFSTEVVGWTNHYDIGGNYGFNFVVNDSVASTTGFPNEYGEMMTFWGPGNGVNNGLTSSPTGGNYIAADGAFHMGMISQTIEGLIVGESYTLSFDYGAAQQYGYDGPTTENWQFGMGSTAWQTTPTIYNPEHGFSGWYHQTYNFVATSTIDTLYFLASGTPDGQPPFSLLDSVSLVGPGVSAAPDPATWMMMLVGFGAIGMGMRRKRVATGVALA